ncbi:MAG: chemotaxis protein CheR [Cyanobacteria bacterium PR.3.49]|nr:chemotaxis protein CheR [Cyanobacteria bacterium PR.3.49]
MNAEGEKFDEIAPILQEIFRRTGADYRNYSATFLERRFSAFLLSNGLSSLAELKLVLFENRELLQELFDVLALPTTRMFRDAPVFRMVREKVIPELAASRLEKVWSAGCSTGEEAYSLSIMLKEELPGKKLVTFATDYSEKSLRIARKGIYSLRRMRVYTQAYLESGGTQDFSSYYFADQENAIMNENLKRDLVFALHNLVTDSTFNEFDLIFCRNVLIYFNRKLQQHVMQLLFRSLRPGGILVLGDKESLRSMISEGAFEEVDRFSRIFRKR